MDASGVEHFALEEMAEQQVVVHRLGYNGRDLSRRKLDEGVVSRGAGLTAMMSLSSGHDQDDVDSDLAIAREPEPRNFAELAEVRAHLVFVEAVRNAAEVHDAAVAGLRRLCREVSRSQFSALTIRCRTCVRGRFTAGRSLACTDASP